jgi:hypothetical protein
MTKDRGVWTAEEYGLNGPTLPPILSELDGIEPIDTSLRACGSRSRA